MAAVSSRGIQRVLLTGDTVGGVWTFTLELAEGLAANGIEVVLACLGGQPSPAQSEEALAISNLYLLGSDFKLEWMDDPWKDVEQSGRWLRRVEREFSPDIVHLNSFGHGALPWKTPTVLTAHSCVQSWWAAVHGQEAPMSWARYRTEVTRALWTVDLVTAPSKAMAAALTRHYGTDTTVCRVISNGRNAARFHRPGDLLSREPFILTAGRVWDKAKNIAGVARVAPNLPWPVYVAGDSQGLHLEGCRMLGRLSASELANWYARAAIYVLPARYEPFGLSVLEAALSGCALVLGDIASLREIWGDAALFVPPDDEDALRTAIEALIGNVSLREEMSLRARARGLEFDAARMSRQYLEAYRDVIRTRKRQCA